MVRKVGKYGVNSGNTLRLTNKNRYLRQYRTNSCIVRRAIRGDNDLRAKYDTGLGDLDLKSDGVPFSLNKKGRWSLPNLIKKEIIHGDHTEDNFGIQLVERHKIAKKADCISVCSTHALSDGHKERTKRHGYLHINSVLKRRSRYSRRVRRDRIRRGLPVEDDIHLQESEPTQVRYDVLYPSPPSCAMTRNPKSIKLETDTYGWDWYASRRRTNRHRKRVSKHLIREAFSILDEEVEDSEEEAYLFSDEECFTPRQTENITLKDVLEQAKALGPLVGISSKVRRASGNSAGHVEPTRKGHVVQLKQDPAPAKSITMTKKETQSTKAKSAALEPVIVILPFEELTPHALREKFDDLYIECDCFPRKFVLNISDKVSRMNKFKGYRKNMTTVNACLVITVDEDNEMNTLTDSVCKVVLNTNYSEKLESIKIETVFDYMETKLSELIDRTLFFIETLPDDALQMNATPISYQQRNSNGKQSHLEEIARWSTSSYTVDDAFLLEYFMSHGLRAVKDLGYEVVSHFDSFHANGSQDVSSQEDQFCGICYEVVGAENPATALISCGHWFCNKCWQEHIETKIRYGSITLLCPEYNCKKQVDAGTALSFVSMGTILKYAKCRHDTEVERHVETRWCPNERCGRVLHLNSHNVKIASCICGQQCCVDCLGNPHWPADCDSAKLFQRRMADRGDSGIVPLEAAVGVIVHGKQCPNCKKFVEKNGGCPYMACVCGKAFCWGCGKDYSQDIHSSCHKYGYNDKHGTTEKNIDPEDKLSKIKRRKWYKVALVHRVGQHPIKYKKMNTAAKTLSKKMQEDIIRSEKKGNPITLDFQPAGKSYTKEFEKVPDFLNNIIELYKEVSQLVENVAVLLDSQRSDKQRLNSSLQYTVNRLAYFVNVIYDLFVNADRRNMIETLTRMKQIRLHSRNAIKALVNRVACENI